MNLNWLKKLYKKLAFQNTYDKIKAWKLPPNIDTLFDEIWENLPKSIQNTLFDLIKKIYDKYGVDFAIILLEKILGGMKTRLYGEK